MLEVIESLLKSLFGSNRIFAYSDDNHYTDSLGNYNQDSTRDSRNNFSCALTP